MITEGGAKSSSDSDLISFDPRIYIFGASLESAMAYYSSDDLQIVQPPVEEGVEEAAVIEEIEESARG